MKRVVILTLPKERFSAIDYFLEHVEELEETVGEIVGVRLTAPAYQRMQKDPYIYSVPSEIDECEEWFGEEITIDDKYYPPLTYFLFEQDNSIFVRKIESAERKFEFGNDYNVVINYFE